MTSNTDKKRSEEIKRAIEVPDIEVVQNVIERCIRHGMTRNEVIKFLGSKINPVLISIVWETLKCENLEFFKSYYANHHLKDQILKYTRLQEEQFRLTMELKSIMESTSSSGNNLSNGYLESIQFSGNNVGDLGYSNLHQSYGFHTSTNDTLAIYSANNHVDNFLNELQFGEYPMLNRGHNINEVGALISPQGNGSQASANHFISCHANIGVNDLPKGMFVMDHTSQICFQAMAPNCPMLGSTDEAMYSLPLGTNLSSSYVLENNILNPRNNNTETSVHELTTQDEVKVESSSPNSQIPLVKKSPELIMENVATKDLGCETGIVTNEPLEKSQPFLNHSSRSEVTDGVTKIVEVNCINQEQKVSDTVDSVSDDEGWSLIFNYDTGFLGLDDETTIGCEDCLNDNQS